MLYIVTLLTKEDRVEVTTSCNSKADVANLLLHLNKNYELINIVKVPAYIEPTDLVQKEDGLETGNS
jgi:hypothetical protein